MVNSCSPACTSVAMFADCTVYTYDNNTIRTFIVGTAIRVWTEKVNRIVPFCHGRLSSWRPQGVFPGSGSGHSAWSAVIKR